MMNEAMKQCCGDDGKPDFGEMKRFMEKCGKAHLGDREIEMMKQFCSQEEMPNFEKMKQFMETCGCYLP